MSVTLLEGTAQGEQLKLAGAGAWIAENARSLEAQIEDETRRTGKLKRVDIDMGRVERLDTFGAWLLERLVRVYSSRGCDTKVIGLKDDYRALMDELHGVKLTKPPAHHDNQMADAVAMIGENIFAVGHSISSMINMVGAIAVTS
ncbi:MAG TPA: STAS domain-containing protein, partial [Pseudolabrys sp.]